MTLDLSAFASRPRVTDGVYGTELQSRGLQPGACAELMNVESRQAVLEVARSYVEAGSDVIMTNTLMAHRFGLAAHGLADRAAELARAGARISREATEGADVKVFGSFGPSGKIVMMEDVRRDELAAAFAETACALDAGGADAIVLETFNELAEIELALDAVRGVCDLPVVVSMAFAYGPTNAATMMGESPADLAAMAQAHGAAAVGANCGVGPDAYVRVAAMLRDATDLPVWIKPNAGLPVVKEGETVFPMGPEEFARFVPELIGAGASFVGGCCGCGPKHIRAVRKQVEATL